MPASPTHETTVTTRDRSLVVTRRFNTPARLVFEAWTRPEHMRRWWIPASFGMTFLTCEMDARTGGSYRFVFQHPDFPEPMAFFGRYIEVVPNQRLVWTNEEGSEGSVTTVTFLETDGVTLLTLSDLYPSQEALEAALASGATGAYPEQFSELESYLAR